jgi:hypothetical protein
VANSPVLMKILPVCVIMLTRLDLDQPTGMIAVGLTSCPSYIQLRKYYRHPSAVLIRG